MRKSEVEMPMETVLRAVANSDENSCIEFVGRVNMATKVEKGNGYPNRWPGRLREIVCGVTSAVR